MSTTLRRPKAIVSVVVLTLLALLFGPAAEANRPGSKPSGPSFSSSAPVGIVQITQIDEDGYPVGLLEWTSVAGATEYRIYKTGSIRPTWRLFYILPTDFSSLKVYDKVGSVAVYRVMAVVNSNEVFVGRALFRPKR